MKPEVPAPGWGKEMGLSLGMKRIGIHPFDGKFVALLTEVKKLNYVEAIILNISLFQ